MEEVATTLYRENDALRGLDYRVEKVMTEDSRNVLNVDFRSGDLHGNRGVLRYAREEMMNGFNRAAAKRGLTGAVEISFTVDGREVAPTFWEIPTADAGDGPLPDHIRSR